jgi:hypothetical protein
MARLRVREVAEERGLNLSQLHAAVNRRLPPADKPIALGTMRRYWHSTKNGNIGTDPIELVDVHLLGTIARVLDVPVGDLLNGEELGQFFQARRAA